MRDFVEAAFLAPKGIPTDDLVPGMLVTLAASKATGDRSYCGDIYEVIARNEVTCVIKASGILKKPWREDNKGIHTVQVYEHEFYLASSLADAVQAYRKR